MIVTKVFFVFSYTRATFTNNEKRKTTLVINTLNQYSDNLFFLADYEYNFFTRSTTLIEKL